MKMEMVIFLGEDKENWGQLSALIKRTEAEKIIIVKNKKTEGFPANERCEEIAVDSDKPLIELKEDMMEKLKPKLSGDFEVSLSIASGNGKEHMALIAALLSIPVGIRIVVFTKNGIEVIN